VSDSKSKSGWRARVFVLAAQCMAFYNVDMSQSVYYDGNDLIIKLLFDSSRDCRKFNEELHSLQYRFSLVMPLQIVEEMREVTVDYKPLPLQSFHYDTAQYDSPFHSLGASDYALRSVGGSHEEILSVCTVSDPHTRLQMIENPDHPFLRGLKMYRCHIEAQASNKKQKTNKNNILHMSWPMHQRFDGLNSVGDKHMVPSIAFKFIKSEPEIIEVVQGYPWSKHKVTFSIEPYHNDVGLLEAVGATLKQGSSYDANNSVWITFVHVDSDSEFKTFLEIKYRITKQLWSQNIPVGEDIDNDAMEELERKAILELADGDK
jgi:serine/threonine protein kinase